MMHASVTSPDVGKNIPSPDNVLHHVAGGAPNKDLSLRFNPNQDKVLS